MLTDPTSCPAAVSVPGICGSWLLLVARRHPAGVVTNSGGEHGPAVLMQVFSQELIQGWNHHSAY